MRRENLNHEIVSKDTKIPKCSFKLLQVGPDYHVSPQNRMAATRICFLMRVSHDGNSKMESKSKQQVEFSHGLSCKKLTERSVEIGGQAGNLQREIGRGRAPSSQQRQNGKIECGRGEGQNALLQPSRRSKQKLIFRHNGHKLPAFQSRFTFTIHARCSIAQSTRPHRRPRRLAPVYTVLGQPNRSLKNLPSLLPLHGPSS